MSNQENEMFEEVATPLNELQAEEASRHVQQKLQDLLNNKATDFVADAVAKAAPIQRVEEVLGKDSADQLKRMVISAAADKVKDIGKPALAALVGGLVAVGAKALLDHRNKTAGGATKIAKRLVLPDFTAKSEVKKVSSFQPNKVWLWNSPEPSMIFGKNKISLAPGEAFITNNLVKDSDRVMCSRMGADSSQMFDMSHSFFDNLAANGYIKLIEITTSQKKVENVNE